MDAKRVIEYALSQIGTAEDPLGSNKQPYGAMLDELPWYLYKEGTNIDMHQYWPIFDVNIAASNGTLWNDYLY